MASSVAAINAPTTQPSDKMTAMHDGKNEINSPSTDVDFITAAADDDLHMLSKECLMTGSETERIGLVSPSGASPMNHGKDEGQDDLAAQEPLANGDYRPDQTGSTPDNNDNTSCFCPNRPNTQPATKHPNPIPRKVHQPRVPHPKLPPKPSHLLQHRSSSSENLLRIKSSEQDREAELTGRERRSQSVSVVTVNDSQQRENIQEPKAVKRPVPAPRKSLPHIFAISPSSPPSGEMNNLFTSGINLGPKQNTPPIIQESETPDSSSKPSPYPGESLQPESSSSHSVNPANHSHPDDAQKTENGMKKPRKISSGSRHVRVRERAAIFEKLIEEETTKNRDSQISEPRSRTSSRASDVNEPPFSKAYDSHSSQTRSRNQHRSYENLATQDMVILPDSMALKKNNPAEDETLSTASFSSDDVFPSPQSSIRSRTHHISSPTLSEDEQTTDVQILHKKSSYANVFRDSSAQQGLGYSKLAQRDDDYTDVVVGDSRIMLDVQEPHTKIENSKSIPNVAGTGSIQESNSSTKVAHETNASHSSKKSEILYRESDYTDVIVPDSHARNPCRIENSECIPDATGNIKKSNSSNKIARESKTSHSSKTSESLYRESDYTDVVIPDSSKLPKRAFQVSSRPLEPKFSLPVKQDKTSPNSTLNKHELLSPEHASSLPKPFHGAYTYRNVTPMFCAFPKQRQSASCGATESSNHEHDDDARTEEYQRKLTNSKDLLGAKTETITKSDTQKTDQSPVTDNALSKTDPSNITPEPRPREGRTNSQSSGLYEVWLPDFIDPVSLTKRNGATEDSPIDDGGESVESEIAADSGHDPNQEGEDPDMLCNRSRRQRQAVRKRDSSNTSVTSGRKKWQHESAPANLGGLERQEAVPELPEDDSNHPDGTNRLSQLSSGGSTISSLISNVSIDDAEHLSSDEDYDDVAVPSVVGPYENTIPPLLPAENTMPLLPPKGENTIPPLPPTADDSEEDQEGRQHVLPGQNAEEDETYSTLYDLQGGEQEMEKDDDVPSSDVEEVEQEQVLDEKQDLVPVEIEMQPMRSKLPRSPDKDNRRKAFEFHVPLFLRNSSSVESTSSISYSEGKTRLAQTTYSEDSDASSDDISSIPRMSESRDNRTNARDSSTSYEHSEDNLSVGSGHSMSTDSLNVSTLKSELQDCLQRRRVKGVEYRRPVSEYDRPTSSVLSEHDRPVSCISEYDRPISSSSADYIGVLNSFHDDEKKDENQGFTLSWTLDHGEEGSQDDERYRPIKSEESPQTKPAKYALPRRSPRESAEPVPVMPTVGKALKPPKALRPYSEPSVQKARRDSNLGKGKNLPVPSKEEITEQLCKISRQRSRFVSQEPLFQLYQEDARSRDSYFRLNVSSLESLTAFLEKQEALKKEKRGSAPNPIPEYRVLIPDEEVYRYQSGEEIASNDRIRHQSEDKLESELEDKQKHGHQSGDKLSLRPQPGDRLREAIYQSPEPLYEPPGELFYDTGDILQNNTIYESGSLGSSTGEGSGGSSSDVELPKPYGLMPRTMVSGSVRRSYWSELPEVISSGMLEQMTPEEKRLQEALFEVITSEASYLRSLNLVVEHFSEAITLQPPTGLLNKVQHHRLFSNIRSVRDASERLLLELEERQQDSVIINDVCDILLQHFEKSGFNCYIVYCANNQYQIKTLEELRKSPSFIEVIKLLESSPACCCLDLQSFLMLPFQRITRLPLLIEAIRQQARMGSPLLKTSMEALMALRYMAEKCNEEAKRMEMIEEVTQLANQLDFREGVKKMNLSQTTSVVKRGRIQLIKKDNKLLNRGKLIAKAVYVIVFTDKVAICKQRMKGEQLKYDVFDWCPRNLVQVESVIDPQHHGKLPDGVPSTCKHVFILSFLQNNLKKEVEFAMDANSEAEKERWMDAMHPAKKTEDGETIYESWDCPQVICQQPYNAQDRDELKLDTYDRVDIHKKVEGWYYGTRVSDHAKGWFPATFTQEVVNDHVLARNLKQRHRLLSLCDQRLRMARNVKK